MRIKILKCSDSFLWYNKRIGEEFTVESITVESKKKLFWVREGGTYNCINYVYEKDCEEINV